MVQIVHVCRKTKLIYGDSAKIFRLLPDQKHSTAAISTIFLFLYAICSFRRKKNAMSQMKNMSEQEILTDKKRLDPLNFSLVISVFKGKRRYFKAQRNYILKYSKKRKKRKKEDPSPKLMIILYD